MFFVYVIKNRQRNKFYIGQTENIENRLKRHNGLLKSKTRSYTKINNGKWELVYKEEYNTRKEALSREKFLKSHKGRDLLKTIMVR